MKAAIPYRISFHQLVILGPCAGEWSGRCVRDPWGDIVRSLWISRWEVRVDGAHLLPKTCASQHLWDVPLWTEHDYENKGIRM